jgi:hypothetical protein
MITTFKHFKNRMVSVLIFVLFISKIVPAGGVHDGWQVESSNDGDCWVNLPAGVNVADYDNLRRLGFYGILCKNYSGPCSGLKNACGISVRTKEHSSMSYSSYSSPKKFSGKCLVIEPLPKRIAMRDVAMIIIDGNLLTIKQAVYMNELIYTKFEGKDCIAVLPGTWTLMFNQSLGNVTVSLEAGEVYKAEFGDSLRKSGAIYKQTIDTRTVDICKSHFPAAFELCLPDDFSMGAQTLQDSLRLCVWDSIRAQQAIDTLEIPFSSRGLRSASVLTFVVGALALPAGIMLHVNGVRQGQPDPADFNYEWDYEQAWRSARQEKRLSHTGGVIIDVLGLASFYLGAKMHAKARRERSDYLRPYQEKLNAINDRMEVLRQKVNTK